MEAHLVYYNRKYGSMSKASSKKDGVAVVALFIEAEGNVANKKFNEISRHISKIQKAGEKRSTNKTKSNL